MQSPIDEALRFHNNGTMATAKPCLTCQAMLKGFGVKIVRYTSEEGIKEYETV